MGPAVSQNGEELVDPVATGVARQHRFAAELASD